MRRAAPLPALAALALALAGCESSQEKSAKLEKVEAARAAVRKKGEAGLSIATPSRRVKVLETALVKGSEGAAVAVTLRNDSPESVRDVPIAVTVRGAGGTTVYTNTGPGLQRTLTTIALVPARSELVWVDDQVPAGGSTASAVVGESPVFTGAVPHLEAGTPKLIEDPSNGVGAEGSVANRSSVTQQELVVSAVARTGGRITAAGRSVVSQLSAGASQSYQVFFVGNPKGASLQVSAPPSSLP